MNCRGRELPDPLELVVKGCEDTPIGYACPKCGASYLIHRRKDPKLYEADRQHQQEEAAAHCVKECVCGELIEQSYRLRCQACLAQMEADKEQKLFEKAQKLRIEEYDGPIYWEGHTGDMGDGYFSDVDALLDYCEQNGVEVPEYTWACEKNELKLHAEHIVENAVSDMYEDAYDSIPEKAIDSLQAYLDAWCKEVSIVSWSDDRSRVIILREQDVPLEAPALAG